MADAHHDPGRRELLGHVERALQLRREGDEPDGAVRGDPLVGQAGVDRQKLVDRDRPGRLGVEERPLQVEAQAEWVVDGSHVARREQIAGDTARRDGARVVDVQVDEAREEERLTRSILPPRDRCDEIALDRDLARVDPLNRVNDKSL